MHRSTQYKVHTSRMSYGVGYEGVATAVPKRGTHLEFEHFARTIPIAKMENPQPWAHHKDHSRAEGAVEPHVEPP